jgi:carbamate kinase
MSPQSTDKSKPILLVALGGNALIQKGQKGTAAEQFDNLKLPLRQIAELSLTYRIIITHGNGPQVGSLLLQQEYCMEDVPKLPLEILVAQTEGQIGYMIESTLDGELMERGIHARPLVSLITYVVVDRTDAAFQKPTKPIGPAFTAEQAAGLPYPTMETPKGHRRVVASPRPVTIIEKREIRKLIEMDFIVICCGGGGIPVTREDRAFLGVDAVIDKDLASARLAAEVGVDAFVIATDVKGVYTDFGGVAAELLSEISLDRAEHLARAGALGTGSMLPKVEACCQFIKNGGRHAAITDIGHIAAAVAGKAGTRFRV